MRASVGPSWTKSFLKRIQEQITALIMKWEINPNIASMIAAGCTGNVRQALLDLESHLDLQYSNNLINKLAA